MNKLALLLALTITAAAAQAEIYRWVDENGETVYSGTPPPDGVADRIKTAPAPTGSLETQRHLEVEMQKLEDYREDKALAAEKKQEDERNKQLNEENCRKARSNLDNLIAATSRRLVRMPDGSYQRLTEEQRQQQMEEARTNIDKYCK